MRDVIEGGRGSAGRKEAWRWTANAYYTRRDTIQVIEKPKDGDDDGDANGDKVPFGFGVRDKKPQSAPVDPLLWEGDGA